MSTTLVGFDQADAPRELTDCRLCHAIAAPTAVWDEPLFESESFVAVPSLGALVPGWLLLVPKEHYLSFAALPKHVTTESDVALQLVRELVTREFGPAWLFEHGPASEHRRVGCGVDHAHLHIVPLSLDLIAAAERFLPFGCQFKRGTLKESKEAIQRGLDYLYVCSPTNDTRIATSARFGSQVFRRAISHALGRSGDYDWRGESGLQEILDTKVRLDPRNWQPVQSTSETESA